MFVVGNHLLTAEHIKRLLEYKYGKHIVFDYDYKLYVMTNKLDMVNLSYMQYIKINENTFQIMTKTI
jgi:hypothetical protein